MSANPLDIRLRGHDDLLIAFEKRIESLETSRAFHADTLKRLADRIDKLSDAFRSRTDELAGLLESAINLGQHQSSQQTDAHLRLGVSMDTLQEALIRMQSDMTHRIAGLSIDMKNLQDRTTKLNAGLELTDRGVDTLAANVRAIQQHRDTPEFIRYTHADDLQEIIDKRVIEQLKRFARLFFVEETSTDLSFASHGHSHDDIPTSTSEIRKTLKR